MTCSILDGSPARILRTLFPAIPYARLRGCSWGVVWVYRPIRLSRGSWRLLAPRMVPHTDHRLFRIRADAGWQPTAQDPTAGRRWAPLIDPVASRHWGLVPCGRACAVWSGCEARPAASPSPGIQLPLPSVTPPDPVRDIEGAGLVDPCASSAVRRQGWAWHALVHDPASDAPWAPYSYQGAPPPWVDDPSALYKHHRRDWVQTACDHVAPETVRSWVASDDTDHQRMIAQLRGADLGVTSERARALPAVPSPTHPLARWVASLGVVPPTRCTPEDREERSAMVDRLYPAPAAPAAPALE